jgi:hypothetical protein
MSIGIIDEVRSFYSLLTRKKIERLLRIEEVAEAGAGLGSIVITNHKKDDYLRNNEHVIGYYDDKSNRVVICLTRLNGYYSLTYVLLHELRHNYQYKKEFPMLQGLIIKDTKEKTYRIEIDADNFVIEMLEKMKKRKPLGLKWHFDEFTEKLKKIPKSRGMGVTFNSTQFYRTSTTFSYSNFSNRNSNTNFTFYMRGNSYTTGSWNASISNGKTYTNFGG